MEVWRDDLALCQRCQRAAAAAAAGPVMRAATYCGRFELRPKAPH